MEYNIYCDESCHMEHDDSNSMALGAVWLPKEAVPSVNESIKRIKEKHGLSKYYEAKWTKVSPSKDDMFLELVDFFFECNPLSFRGLVVPDKSILDHSKYNQTHGEWYDKMYFAMLKKLLKPGNSYYIYPDIKDTHSYHRSKELKMFLSNRIFDYKHECLKRIQPIHSNEVQVMQMVDILTGAIAYSNREFPDAHVKSPAKLHVIERIQSLSNEPLNKTSRYNNMKFNILVWDSEKKGVSHV